MGRPFSFLFPPSSQTEQLTVAGYPVRHYSNREFGRSGGSATLQKPKDTNELLHHAASHHG